MANVELVRLAPDASRGRIVETVNVLIDAQLGNLGARVLMVGHDGTSTDPNLGTSTGSSLYQAVIRSDGTRHLQVRKSDNLSDRLTVTDTSTATPDLTVSTTFSSLGTTTLGDASTDALTVGATSTFNAPATFNANVTLGDAAADALTILATSTFFGPATFSSSVTGSGTVQFKIPTTASATLALALTTTPTNVPGALMNLSPGIWNVTGVFDLSLIGAGDVGQLLLGALAMSGGAATIATAGTVAILGSNGAVTRANVTQSWLVTVTVLATASLQAYKTGGTGSSVCNASHTTITAANA
jgi:hypothetical protein